MLLEITNITTSVGFLLSSYSALHSFMGLSPSVSTFSLFSFLVEDCNISSQLFLLQSFNKTISPQQTTSEFHINEAGTFISFHNIIPQLVQ
jgi:hypothetical protein